MQVPRTITERVKLKKPLSPMQQVIGTLLAVGYKNSQIATELHISSGSVSCHIHAAAAKIPGDLPAPAKLICWVRGATREVLSGHYFKGILVDHGRAAQRQFRKQALLEHASAEDIVHAVGGELVEVLEVVDVAVGKK